MNGGAVAFYGQLHRDLLVFSARIADFSESILKDARVLISSETGRDSKLTKLIVDTIFSHTSLVILIGLPLLVQFEEILDEIYNQFYSDYNNHLNQFKKNGIMQQEIVRMERYCRHKFADKIKKEYKGSYDDFREAEIGNAFENAMRIGTVLKNHE
ncbi:MAG: hypothetical protein MHMPM18_000661 [Marteilia pararefringens]